MTTTTQLVWLNWFTGSNLPNYRKSCVIKRTYILKFVKSPPYENRGRGQTANQSREAIKIITQTCKVIKTVHQKYIKTSTRVGYAPPVWKRVQVQGLMESRLTIKGDEIQGLVSPEQTHIIEEAVNVIWCCLFQSLG